MAWLCAFAASSPRYDTPSFACGVKRQSKPPSTSAELRAIGTPATENAVPVPWKASPAVGVTSPKAYCQATVARGTSTVPLASGMKVAMRTPSEE